MRYFWATLFLLFSFVSSAEELGVSLTVTVTNIPGAKGNLLVGLFDSASSFTSSPMENSPKVPLSSSADQTVVIENVKPGTYAIAVVQDLNGNGKLDKNFLGMPKEPLAFSVIKKIPRGKPDFGACSFEVGTQPVSLTIPLVVE